MPPDGQGAFVSCTFRLLAEYAVSEPSEHFGKGVFVYGDWNSAHSGICGPAVGTGGGGHGEHRRRRLHRGPDDRRRGQCRGRDPDRPGLCPLTGGGQYHPSALCGVQPDGFEGGVPHRPHPGHPGLCGAGDAGPAGDDPRNGGRPGRGEPAHRHPAPPAVCGRRGQRQSACRSVRAPCAGPGHHPEEHHGPSGQTGGLGPERDRLVPQVYRQRGVQRGLPDLAGERLAGEHPLPDLAGAEPHLHRVVPQPGLQLQHHQLHQLRPVLRPWADRVRCHGPADGRHLQYLSPEDRNGQSLLLRILRRQICHLSGPEAVGHGHAGKTGQNTASDPEILLRQQHRDRPDPQHPGHPAELPRLAAAAGRFRHGGVHAAAATEPHREGLPLLRQADRGRRLRPPHGVHSQDVPAAVQPDRRRRGRAADLV